MVSRAGKLLLKNTIQSTELQNKIKEENEMWKKLEKEREDRKRKLWDDEPKPTDRSGRPSSPRMDCKRRKDDDNRPDNYWLKKLIAAEEKVSNDRWTHNGFKEMYSKELASSESSEESEEEIIKKKSKKKKKKHKKHRKKSKHKRK